MVLIVAALICIATALFISVPFWGHRVEGIPLPLITRTQGEDLGVLVEQRDALLRDMKDLEFDLEMGKIEADDYAQLRASTAAAASAVLQKIETITTPATQDTRRKKRKGSAAGTDFISERELHHQSLAQRAELEAEIEVLITRKRRKLAASQVVSNGHAAPIATSGSWQCESCGRTMSDADRFCGSCGLPRSST
ncbi:MAG: hypothetical protein JO316_17345 [Abitibacteriaceae bacterium]|nr:hypothetical protein [Abditibacteriaceae bacterium]MBV9867123.1 hypothetical protein [Abditibacteriaceae bacterium]